ncbi:MAG: hypothetical protein WBF18_01235, partial [Solirubrobacterales bacterium]
LPAAGAMEHDISVKQQKMKRRYVASKRHTIQVDFDDYMKELRLELESCRPVVPGGERPLTAAAV